jgi:hypothetical protein
MNDWIGSRKWSPHSPYSLRRERTFQIPFARIPATQQANQEVLRFHLEGAFQQDA